MTTIYCPHCGQPHECLIAPAPRKPISAERMQEIIDTPDADDLAQARAERIGGPKGY